MSKQEKLISAEKLQEWIDETFERKLPTESVEYRDGRETVLNLLEMHLTIGTFSPDPVPTIKPGHIVNMDGYDWTIREIRWSVEAQDTIYFMTRPGFEGWFRGSTLFGGSRG